MKKLKKIFIILILIFNLSCIDISTNNVTKNKHGYYVTIGNVMYFSKEGHNWERLPDHGQIYGIILNSLRDVVHRWKLERKQNK